MSTKERFAERREREDGRIVMRVLYAVGLYVCFQAGYCIGYVGR